MIVDGTTLPARDYPQENGVLYNFVTFRYLSVFSGFRVVDNLGTLHNSLVRPPWFEILIQR